jgi:predicted transcriptional regulator
MRENVNSLSSAVNSLEWRRSKVLELTSQGHSQPEIARILQISQPTVNRDIGYLRGQARQNLQKHIQDKLPEEYQNCMTGINQVLKICWDIVNKSRNTNNNDNDGHQIVTMTDNKTVLQALALINDCNKYKMDLTTNGVVITDTIKFVQKNKEKLTTMSKKEDNDNNDSEEPDYDEDKDQLEEEQEKESGEQETTNKVF